MDWFKKRISFGCHHVSVYCFLFRYLRKLDQELHKFKMELEADNSGITEILERRSLEMDAPAASTGTAKENRLPKKQVHKMISQHYLIWFIEVSHSVSKTFSFCSRPERRTRL